MIGVVLSSAMNGTTYIVPVSQLRWQHLSIQFMCAAPVSPAVCLCASVSALVTLTACVAVLQREQMSQRMGGLHRGAGHAPHPQAPPPSQGGAPRLNSRDSDPRQLQPHAHFSGLQPQGIDRQPQQPQGLSNYQHHQIQQAYNALMQHKQQLSTEEGAVSGHPISEPAYPLQPVPSRPGPNNMLGLPSYARALPSMTSNDYDTIMKLKEQLSGLTSFMQAQRSSEQRPMPGLICSCVLMLGLICCAFCSMHALCVVCSLVCSCHWVFRGVVGVSISCSFTSCGAAFCGCGCASLLECDLHLWFATGLLQHQRRL